MPQPFHVEHAPRDGAIVLTLRGDAGMLAADALERHVNAVAAAHPRRVVIDATGLTFLASLTLGLLVRLSHAVRAHGGEVRFAGATADVRDMLGRTRLTTVFPLFPSVDAALTEP